jgi:hypothetical protein
MLCPSLSIKFNKTALLQGNGQAMSDLYGDAVAEWPVGSRCILLAGSFFLWIFPHHAARMRPTGLYFQLGIFQTVFSTL